jgi:hypothetical protein
MCPRARPSCGHIHAPPPVSRLHNRTRRTPVASRGADRRPRRDPRRVARGLDGGVAVRWSYHFTAKPGRGALVHLLIGPMWKRYMRKGLAASIREAERVTGPTGSG